MSLCVPLCNTRPCAPYGPVVFVLPTHQCDVRSRGHLYDPCSFTASVVSLFCSTADETKGFEVRGMDGRVVLGGSKSARHCRELSCFVMCVWCVFCSIDKHDRQGCLIQIPRMVFRLLLFGGTMLLALRLGLALYLGVVWGRSGGGSKLGSQSA